jgi:hypothetical protein
MGVKDAIEMSKKILLDCATSVEPTVTVETTAIAANDKPDDREGRGQGPAAKNSRSELRTLVSRAARNHDWRAARKQHSRFLDADIARRSRRSSLLRQIG